MKQYHLSDKSLQTHFKKWLALFLANESGHIYFLPFSGASYRIWQFVEWCKKEGEDVEVLDIATLDIEDQFDLREKLNVSFKKHTILWNRDPLLLSQLSFFYSLEDYLVSNKKVALIFHEYLPQNTESGVTIHTTFSKKNMLIFPLHTFKEVGEFCQSITKSWEIPNLSEDDLKIVFHMTGGFLWLVKEVVRQLRLNQHTSLKSIFSSENFVLKVDLIWQSFPNQVKHIMKKRYQLHQELSTHEEKVWGMLKKFGLVTANNALPQFIFDKIKLDQNTMQISPTKVIVNEMDISNLFSQSQKRLLTTLQNKAPELISRDKVGQAYWGPSWADEYSDWALDKAISRLRKKITSINIGLQIITKRGVGYGLRTI